MLFRTGVYLKLKSLQAVLKGAINDLSSSVFSQKNHPDEKASRCTFERIRGSLTVEAALVFPLFLFTLTALLYLFLFLQLQTEVGRALTDTARELAQDSWLAESGQDLTVSLAAAAYAEAYLEQYLEGRGAAEIVKGGRKGISTLGSSWNLESSDLILRASYQVLLPPGLSWFRPVSIMQTKTVRGWTGFGRRLLENEEKSEAVVYVTTYGTVYHESLDCRHLKHSIRQVTIEEVPGLRNTDGARYYPCEHCWEGEGTMIYITENGNRYHATLHCQGLRRGIRTVRMTELEGLLPCSECGESE